LWTGRNNDPKAKDTYQYILDLQNIITETCEFAQQELSKIRNKNQKYFNTNAKLRQLNPQDRVWVLNTKTQSKFDFNWLGPATVLERRGHVVYKIKFDNGSERMYHINMLKSYVERESFQLVEEPSRPEESLAEEQTDMLGISAAIMGLVDDSDIEDDYEDEKREEIRLGEESGHINIANVEETETWKNVKINPELSKSDQDIIRFLFTWWIKLRRN